LQLIVVLQEMVTSHTPALFTHPALR